MWPWANPPPPLAADGSQGLGWRFIRSRPTRLGWGLLLVCLLLWVMAVNYQVNVAYVLVFWLLGVLLAGVLMCWRQLLGLSIQADTESECFAGEAPVVVLRAGMRGRYRRWLWLRLGQHQPERADDWQPWPLAAAADTPLNWVLPPQPRGFLLVPPLRCVSMAPFGVVLAESLWQYNGNAVVYPAPIAHELPARHTAATPPAATAAPWPAAMIWLICKSTIPVLPCSMWRGSSLPKPASYSTNALKTAWPASAKTGFPIATTRRTRPKSNWPGCCATAYCRPSSNTMPIRWSCRSKPLRRAAASAPCV